MNRRDGSTAAGMSRKRGRVSRASDARPVFSVTALMVYEICPWQYFLTFVEGLPPPVSSAMRRGTDVHKLIADHYRQPSLLVPEGDGGAHSLFRVFLSSRFNVMPMEVERKFVLSLEGADVRGRIDAVLPREGGVLEIVDFKSGAAPRRDAVQASLQLPVYALTVSERHRLPPENLMCTYFYLGDGKELSFYPTEESVRHVRARLDRLIEGILARAFEPAEGCTCFACMRAVQS